MECLYYPLTLMDKNVSHIADIWRNIPIMFSKNPIICLPVYFPVSVAITSLSVGFLRLLDLCFSVQPLFLIQRKLMSAVSWRWDSASVKSCFSLLLCLHWSWTPVLVSEYIFFPSGQKPVSYFILLEGNFLSLNYTSMHICEICTWESDIFIPDDWNLHMHSRLSFN